MEIACGQSPTEKSFGRCGFGEIIIYINKSNPASSSFVLEQHFLSWIEPLIKQILCVGLYPMENYMGVYNVIVRTRSGAGLPDFTLMSCVTLGRFLDLSVLPFFLSCKVGIIIAPAT